MNEAVFLILNNLVVAYPWLGPIAIFLASYLAWIIIFSLVALIFFATDRRRAVAEVFAIFVVAGVAWVLAHELKLWFATPRPFLTLPHVHPLIGDLKDYSFPSGHATFFMALALATYHYRKALGLWFLLGALAIGVARIVVGVHWPLDIIGGFILGGLVAFFGSFITPYIVRRLTLRK